MVLAGVGALAFAGCTGREGSRETTTTTSPSPTAINTRTDVPEPNPPESIESDWPLPDYDAGRSRYTSATDGPPEPVASLWQVPVDTTLSPPVVADGMLYVGGDDGIVRALDARTGAERWRTSLNSAAGAPRGLGGRLYVPTEDAIVALHADDGETEWRTETPDRTGSLATDHGVYYVSGSDESAVVALDDDGNRRWHAAVDGPWMPPLFAGGGYVFVSTGLYWSEPWVFDAADGTYRGEHRPQNGADMTGERFYLDGKVVSADGFFGDVEINEVADGRYDRVWRTALDAYAGFKLAGGEKRCFLATTGGDEPGLYALSLTNGEVAWHTDAVAALATRPAVANETVVVATSDALWAFDPTDGSKRWRFPLAGIRGLALVDDIVYATTGEAVVALRSV